MTIRFEGAISCKAVLEENKRDCLCLYMDAKKKTRDFGFILSLAAKLHVPVKRLDRKEMDAMSASKGYGGVLLDCQTREYSMPEKLPDGFLCYINGVEDPYNIGSICRTLYAAGCSALILDQRDWSKSEAVIQKASAGAFEKMEIFMTDSQLSLLELCKKQKIPFICASRKDAISLETFAFPDTFCLALGGALRGLNAKVMEEADERVYIEYLRDFRNSLDTASSTAIFSFAYVQQMLKRK